MGSTERKRYEEGALRSNEATGPIRDEGASIPEGLPTCAKAPVGKPTRSLDGTVWVSASIDILGHDRCHALCSAVVAHHDEATDLDAETHSPKDQSERPGLGLFRAGVVNFVGESGDVYEFQ